MSTYQGVQLAIRSLYQARVRVQENCGKEPDFLHGVCIALEDDPVANIEWVFYEQKYNAGQNFLQAPANQPTKTYSMHIKFKVSQCWSFCISVRTENQGASASNESCQRSFLEYR